jgi:hypothetical protein
MKTDATTSSPLLQSQIKKFEGSPSKNPKLPPGSLPLEGKGIGPDYKLDLSSPSMPSLPSAPSLPTPSIPDLPKPQLKASDFAQEEVKDGVKEEAKEKAREIKVEKVEEKDGSAKRPAIIFIKGMDVFSSPLKSETGYAGVGKIADSVKGSKVFSWKEKAEILKEIKKVELGQPVILVGHSFGGDTAVDIANDLDSLEHQFRPVDLLITMDAIGFNNDIIPQNVKEHLNIFGERDFFLNDGPHVARRNEKTEVKNILSPLNHTELDDDKGNQFEIVTLIQKKLAKPS